MIKRIDKTKKDIEIWELLIALLLFLAITFFLFYSFINLCFQTFLNDPSLPLMIACFVILIIDEMVLMYIEKKPTLEIIVNPIIIVGLVLAWQLNNPYAQLLGVIVFLKFPQIIRFNRILNERLTTRRKLFKFLVVCKIFYMMLLVGNVIGCTFYLIDNTLIKQRYYGIWYQNPNLYYQGAMTCFSPIYGLNQADRYVYGMYYSISLLSTVAFGDIIPKNPYENLYVLFLLVIATISISLILQQMIIYFRADKIKRDKILNKIKYLRYNLHENCISYVQSQRIIRYLIYRLWYKTTRYPNLSKLTLRMRRMILFESVRDVALPSLVLEEIIFSMNSKYFPTGYVFIDNHEVLEEICFYILLRGKIRKGYGEKILGRDKTIQKGSLFGYEELITQTKSIKPGFKAICVSSVMLLSFSLSDLMNSFAKKSKNQQEYHSFLEKYHLEREKVLFQKKMPCYICNQQTHDSYECPTCHYSTTFGKIDHFQPRKSVFIREGRGRRKKIKGKTLFTSTEKQETENEEKHHLAELYQQRLKHLVDEFEHNQFKHFEKYECWRTFHPDFNLL